MVCCTRLLSAFRKSCGCGCGQPQDFCGLRLRLITANTTAKGGYISLDISPLRFCGCGFAAVRNLIAFAVGSPFLVLRLVCGWRGAVAEGAGVGVRKKFAHGLSFILIPIVHVALARLSMHLSMRFCRRFAAIVAIILR